MIPDSFLSAPIAVSFRFKAWPDEPGPRFAPEKYTENQVRPVILLQVTQLLVEIDDDHSDLNNGILIYRCYYLNKNQNQYSLTANLPEVPQVA